MPTFVLRSAFNYDRDEASRSTGLACVLPSRTDQSFKEECDINTLVERFGLGYQMPENLRLPQYGDFTGLDSYHDACNAIAEAGEQFDLLPANIRSRFNNDPGQFVDFCLDDNNRDEAVKLGLVPAPVPSPTSPNSSPTEPVVAAGTPATT